MLNKSIQKICTRHKVPNTWSLLWSRRFWINFFFLHSSVNRSNARFLAGSTEIRWVVFNFLFFFFFHKSLLRLTAVGHNRRMLYECLFGPCAQSNHNRCILTLTYRFLGEEAKIDNQRRTAIVSISKSILVINIAPD